MNTIKELKAIIKEHNVESCIKGYSKLKRPELVALLLANKDKIERALDGSTDDINTSNMRFIKKVFREFNKISCVRPSRMKKIELLEVVKRITIEDATKQLEDIEQLIESVKGVKKLKGKKVKDVVNEITSKATIEPTTTTMGRLSVGKLPDKEFTDVMEYKNLLTLLSRDQEFELLSKEDTLTKKQRSFAIKRALRLKELIDKKSDDTERQKLRKEILINEVIVIKNRTKSHKAINAKNLANRLKVKLLENEKKASEITSKATIEPTSITKRRLDVKPREEVVDEIDRLIEEIKPKPKKEFKVFTDPKTGERVVKLVDVEPPKKQPKKQIGKFHINEDFVELMDLYFDGVELSGSKFEKQLYKTFKNFPSSVSGRRFDRPDMERNIFNMGLLFREAFSRGADFFPTSNVCAKHIIDDFLKDYDGEKLNILEPSMGSGQLLNPLIDLNNLKVIDINKIVGIEFLSSMVSVMEVMTTGIDIIRADFLEIEPDIKFNLIIMNPPFTKKENVKGKLKITKLWLSHVLHATKFLTNGGVLYSILPAGNLKELDKQLNGYEKIANCDDFVFVGETGKIQKAGIRVAVIKYINKSKSKTKITTKATIEPTTTKTLKIDVDGIDDILDDTDVKISKKFAINEEWKFITDHFFSSQRRNKTIDNKMINLFGDMFKDDDRNVRLSRINQFLVNNFSPFFDLFPTPKHCVDVILNDIINVEQMGSEVLNILEPSMGTGNIISGIFDRIKNKELRDVNKITAVEFVKDLCELNKRFITGVDITCGDFLKMPKPKTTKEQYNLIIMNPPFTDGKNNQVWQKHLVHAYYFKKTRGVLYAIVPKMSESNIKILTRETLKEFDAEYNEMFIEEIGECKDFMAFKKGELKKLLLTTSILKIAIGGVSLPHS